MIEFRHYFLLLQFRSHARKRYVQLFDHFWDMYFGMVAMRLLIYHCHSLIGDLNPKGNILSQYQHDLLPKMWTKFESTECNAIVS